MATLSDHILLSSVTWKPIREKYDMPTIGEPVEVMYMCVCACPVVYVCGGGWGRGSIPF